MNRTAIIEQIDIHHSEFRHLLGSLSETEYLAAPIGKWSAGQQLDHICRSVGPVNLAFGMPAFILRIVFGKANRPSRTYEALVEKYKTKLAEGGRAAGRFIPAMANWAQREKLLRRLEKMVAALARKIEKMDENQLDTYILPHPLLGKLTLREMLYFTIYHVQHHQNLVLSNPELRSGAIQ
ncbi:MAG: DinB family protein [Phycisphaerae bacterium]|nr:DinB family protein [Saprospiraceae bacterium]